MIKRSSKAFAIIEYAMLILIVMVGFIVMKKYIARGFMGQWKKTGDSYGLGRQYDPRRTLDCVFYQRKDDKKGIDIKVWYEQGCFDHSRLSCAIGDKACEENIILNVCAIPACQDEDIKK